MPTSDNTVPVLPLKVLMPTSDNTVPVIHLKVLMPIADNVVHHLKVLMPTSVNDLPGHKFQHPSRRGMRPQSDGFASADSLQ